MNNSKLKTQNSKLTIIRKALIFIFLFFCAYQVFAATPNISYDGLWFMGFNLHKDLFEGESGTTVRQAIEMALDRREIAMNLAKSERIPDSIIPYGMEGYEESETVTLNVRQAKRLMRKAGYGITDKRIKAVRLLHTNGVLTKAIAREIKENLKHIGIKVQLTGLDYRYQEKWDKTLKSGQYHLHLMGFKAEDPDDVLSFLTPLFHSEGHANVTYYNHPTVDKLLDSLPAITDPEVRRNKLDRVQRLLITGDPVIGLFYIRRL